MKRDWGEAAKGNQPGGPANHWNTEPGINQPSNNRKSKMEKNPLLKKRTLQDILA